MTKVLVLAEKPSSAQKIALALSGGRASKKSAGKVSSYEFERDGKQFVVVPAVGHLFSLAEKQKSNTYPVFEVEWKPSSEVSEAAEFTKEYFNNIKKLSKGAKEFVASTDYDLEGEVIAGNVMQFAAGVSPSKVRRMKFSTLTTEELQEAFSNASPSLDLRLLEAGRTRHEMDFYWGISLSRALMAAIKSAGRFQVMSVGRVQGPSLAILALREKEISSFIPTPYWQLFALVKQVVFESERGKILDEKIADEALANSGKKGVVLKVERKKYNQLPPFPFDLTTLQTEAHAHFGITPTQTLEIAQQLYEQAVISYPRTASQKLPAKLNLPKIIQKLSANPTYSKLAQKLIEGKKFSPHEGKKEDPAHPAIFPTGEKPPSLEGTSGKVYDLIVKRFLACFADPAVRERISVELKLGAERYSASGARTLQGNWTEFYSPYAKFEEVTLPDFAEGEQVEASKIWKEKKMTKPPNRFTEASLLRKLEDDNLGTKATRAAIIKTLFDRGYVKDKSIQVTPLGMTVFDALEKNVPQILSDELTRHVEQELEEIQSGEKTGGQVLEEGRETLTKLCLDFRSKEKAIGAKLLASFNQTQWEQNVLGQCNLCKEGKLVVRKSKYGFFVGCSAYPNCRNTFPLPGGASVKATGKLCEKCGTPIVWVRRKGKKPFSMCLLPTCETKKNWGSNAGNFSNAAVAGESNAAKNSSPNFSASPVSPAPVTKTT